MTGTPFSYTFFSTMKPSTSIKPHYGACNLKLRCHFPIIVPSDAFLRVGGDPRSWEEGKMLVFDDCYEHEALNLNKTEDRVILLFDIWHPDIQQDERVAITHMFEKMQELINER
jgi:aspartate beta-hydroxylase